MTDRTEPQRRALEHAARFLDMAPRRLPASPSDAAMWWAEARATIRDAVTAFAEPEEDDDPDGERCLICGAHPGADGSHVVRVSGAHIAAAS